MSGSEINVTVLGAGSSTGTPSVETGWGKCDPHEPKNRRTRPSILVERDGKQLLIDTSPDLRQQLLRHEITHLDGVLFTHAHADHLHGIDDIRGINRRMQAPVPGWASRTTWDDIEARFNYCLTPLPEGRTYYKPVIEATDIAYGEAFSAAGMEILPLEQNHGYSLTTGFRFGSFAYSTDLVEMTDELVASLQGLDTWYVGVFSWRPHPTHVDVDTAIEWVEQVRPKRAIFGHLSNGIDYQSLKSYVPEGITPAFDGMRFEVPV